MIVLTIIMVLSAFAIKMIDLLNPVRDMRMEADSESVSAVIGLCKVKNSSPPKQVETVLKNKNSSSWNKMLKQTPMDSWREKYQYRFPGRYNSESYHLYSRGPDRWITRKTIWETGSNLFYTAFPAA